MNLKNIVKRTSHANLRRQIPVGWELVEDKAQAGDKYWQEFAIEWSNLQLEFVGTPIKHWRSLKVIRKKKTKVNSKISKLAILREREIDMADLVEFPWHPVTKRIITEAEYKAMDNRDKLQLSWEYCDDEELKKTIGNYLWDVYHVKAEVKD